MSSVFRLFIALTLVLAGCGGGGGSGPSDSRVTTISQSNQTEPDVVSVEASGYPLHGSAVKGPLLHATISAYRLDTYAGPLFDSSAPVATGYTDAHAAITGLIIPAQEQPPLVLVVDGGNSLDVNTGMTPVLTQLIAVVTDAELRGGQAIYPTPLSTLVFHIARLRTASGASASAFLATQTEAVARVADTFPALRINGVDILSDPPLLTSATVSAAQQQRVLTHRLVAEGLASLAFSTAMQRQRAGQTLSANAALELFARDLAGDGALDGKAGDTPLPNVVPELFSRSLTEIVVPNMNTRLDQSLQLLAQDMGYTGINTTLQTAQLRVDASQSLGVQRTPTTTLSGQPAENWTLSWNPNADYIVGYVVYFGPTIDTATVELGTVPLAQLADPAAPSTRFNTTTDLHLSIGEQGCFRLKAYNEAGASEFSEGVCAVL